MLLLNFWVCVFVSLRLRLCYSCPVENRSPVIQFRRKVLLINCDSDGERKLAVARSRSSREPPYLPSCDGAVWGIASCFSAEGISDQIGSVDKSCNTSDTKVLPWGSTGNKSFRTGLRNWSKNAYSREAGMRSFGQYPVSYQPISKSTFGTHPEGVRRICASHRCEGWEDINVQWNGGCLEGGCVRSSSGSGGPDSAISSVFTIFKESSSGSRARVATSPGHIFGSKTIIFRRGRGGPTEGGRDTGACRYAIKFCGNSLRTSAHALFTTNDWLFGVMCGGDRGVYGLQANSRIGQLGNSPRVRCAAHKSFFHETSEPEYGQPDRAVDNRPDGGGMSGKDCSDASGRYPCVLLYDEALELSLKIFRDQWPVQRPRPHLWHTPNSMAWISRSIQ